MTGDGAMSTCPGSGRKWIPGPWGFDICCPTCHRSAKVLTGKKTPWRTVKGKKLTVPDHPPRQIPKHKGGQR